MKSLLSILLCIALLFMGTTSTYSEEPAQEDGTTAAVGICIAIVVVVVAGAAVYTVYKVKQCYNAKRKCCLCGRVYPSYADGGPRTCTNDDCNYNRLIPVYLSCSGDTNTAQAATSSVSGNTQLILQRSTNLVDWVDCTNLGDLTQQGGSLSGEDFETTNFLNQAEFDAWMGSDTNVIGCPFPPVTVTNEAMFFRLYTTGIAIM